MPLPQRQRQVSPITPNSAVPASQRKYIGDQNSEATLLDRWMKVAKLGSAVLSDHFQEVAEEDAIRQISRYQDGKAPSDNATVAGYRAHAVAQMNTVIMQHTSVLSDKSRTFIGTREEWNQIVFDTKKSVRDQIKNDHPNIRNDTDFIRAENALFNQEYNKVARQRSEDAVKIEHNQRLRTLGRNFIEHLKAGKSREEIEAFVETAPGAMGLNMEQEVYPILNQVLIDEFKLGMFEGEEFARRHVVDEKTGATLFDLSSDMQLAYKSGWDLKFREASVDIEHNRVQLYEKERSGEITPETLVDGLMAQNVKWGRVVTHNAEIQRILASAKAKGNNTFDAGKAEQQIHDNFVGTYMHHPDIAIERAKSAAADDGITLTKEHFKSWTRESDILLENITREEEATQARLDKYNRDHDPLTALTLSNVDRKINKLAIEDAFEGTNKVEDYIKSGKMPNLEHLTTAKVSEIVTSAREKATNKVEAYNDETATLLWQSVSPEFAIKINKEISKYDSGGSVEDFESGYLKLVDEKNRRGFLKQSLLPLRTLMSILSGNRDKRAKEIKLQKDIDYLMKDSIRWQMPAGDFWDPKRKKAAIDRINETFQEMQDQAFEKHDTSARASGSQLRQQFDTTKLAIFQKHNLVNPEYKVRFSNLALYDPKTLQNIDPVNDQDFSYVVQENINLFRGMSQGYKYRVLEGDNRTRSFLENIAAYEPLAQKEGWTAHQLHAKAWKAAYDPEVAKPEIIEEIVDEVEVSGSWSDPQELFIKGIAERFATVDVQSGIGIDAGAVDNVNEIVNTHVRSTKLNHMSVGDESSIINFMFENDPNDPLDDPDPDSVNEAIDLYSSNKLGVENLIYEFHNNTVIISAEGSKQIGEIIPIRDIGIYYEQEQGKALIVPSDPVGNISRQIESGELELKGRKIEDVMFEELAGEQGFKEEKEIDAPRFYQ